MQLHGRTIRDGFRVLKSDFRVPADIGQWDVHKKRKVTICNLFVNHRLSTEAVARVRDETYKHVVDALIERGIVEDRRHLPRTSRESSKGAYPKPWLKRES
jgi:hypothetical protein